MGLTSFIKGSPEKENRAPEGSDPDDTEILDDEPKNILLSLISQLRLGMDLSKVTLPVFVLEPRSMLERVTDFHSHPDILHGASQLSTPEERFVRVLKYYLAGWHIKPKGVKKPYNPVLGEFFRCRYDYADGTSAYYISEQVSHHPPISAWAFFSPGQKLYLYGELRPKSKFLGNSAATIMEGENRVVFLDRPDDGVYRISMPNMYARGILFGKMVLELGDEAKVRNDKTKISCDLDFKTKGFFSGAYNQISGKVKNASGSYAELSGKWSDTMDITIKGKPKTVLFNAHESNISKITVSPEDQQQPNESRRLWSDVTAAILAKDLDAATKAKATIEDAQRDSAREREAKNETFTPKYFVLKSNDEYHPAFEIDPKTTIEEQVAAVRAFVYGEDAEPAVAAAVAAPGSSAA